MKTYFKRYFIASFFIVYVCFSSIAQPNFVIDTILLPGHYIQKVSCESSSDVWVIADTSSRQIYRIDKNLTIYNNSGPFQSATQSKFSTILNIDTNFTLVGTQNDYIYNWTNTILSKIDISKGLLDSTINGMVRSTGISCFLKIGVSAEKSTSFSNDGINYTSNSIVGYTRIYEAGDYYFTSSTIYKYTLGCDPRLANSIGMKDCATFYSVNLGGSYHVNTATVLHRHSSLNRYILVGTDSCLILTRTGGGIPYSIIDQGKKYNKVKKYLSRYVLLASDSGIYIFDYSNAALYQFSKASFPGNIFKANDIDISPDGCIWLATDTGLIRLKDLNCNNYKINDFNIVDSILTLTDGCEIKFNTQCIGCSKNWNWDFGDGTANSFEANPIHIYNQSGIYTVSLISDNGVCSDTLVKNISLIICCDSSNYDFPKLGNDTSICANTTINLNAGNFFNCDYLWSTGDTAPTINVSSAGNYWVRVTNANGCSSIDGINITVNSLPTPIVTGLSNNYCLNMMSAPLIGTPLGGIYNGNGISGNTFYPDSAGIGMHTISYTYTDTNGCTGIYTQTTYVNPVPNVTIGNLSSKYCIDALPVNLTGSPSGGTYSGNGVSGSTLTPSSAGVGTSSIIYSYTDGNGCANYDTASTTVYALPIKPILMTTDPDTICNGTSVTLTSSSTTGNSWSTGTINQSITTGIAGNYFVTVTDTNNCSSTSDTLALVVDTILNVTITGLSNICKGDTTSLTGIGGLNYSWSTGQTNSLISVAPTTNTVYSISSSNACGTFTNSVNVVVNLLPTVYAGSDTTIILGTSVQLNSSSGTNYLWEPPTGLNCVNCQSPIANPENTTTYYLTVTDNNGCAAIDTIIVTVDKDFVIFVPTVFSPGNDGKNDFIMAQGKGIKEIQFIVYDRWGGKIFESKDLNIGWDGTYKGKALDPATFVYYVKATFMNDQTAESKGDFTLLR